jgi:hypothetical protein
MSSGSHDETKGRLIRKVPESGTEEVADGEVVLLNGCPDPSIFCCNLLIKLSIVGNPQKKLFHCPENRKAGKKS